MPLKRCTRDGKSGWKFGDSGHCYLGPNAKKDAIKQGIKIYGPEKFKKIMKEEGLQKDLASELIEDSETPDDLIDFIMDIAKFDTVERMFANLRRQDIKLERSNTNTQEDV